MKLSIVASNRNRLKLDDNSSQWFLKSLEWQDFNDFELVIADGGSDNYDELQAYFSSFKGNIRARLVQYKIGEAFERAKLNNVGIRQAKGEYIMCTDVDMLYAPKFVSTLVSLLEPNAMIESRTMYWKSPLVESIYRGEKNPYLDIESCKIGRIKKRTTAGGAQCMKKESWEMLRSYNESFIGWGSEDYDLLTRAQMAGLKIKWMGESLESIMLFHQPHNKTNEQIKKDLECQEENKKLLANIRHYQVNPNGWGGVYERNEKNI